MSPDFNPAFFAPPSATTVAILTPSMFSSVVSILIPKIASCTAPNSKISSIIFLAIFEGTANEYPIKEPCD